MTECIVCETEVENKGWCSRCELFADVLVGPGVSGRPTDTERAEMELLLGPDRGRTSEARWRRLLAEHAGVDDITWMKRADLTPCPETAIPPAAFQLDEDAIQQGLQFLRERLGGRTRPQRSELRRLLQRGFPLPDGRWLNGGGLNWSVDGEDLYGKVPYVALLRAMTGGSNERRQAQECDFGLLLGVLGTLSDYSRRLQRNRHRNRHWVRRQEQLVRDPLLRRRHRDFLGPLEGGTLFFGWLEWLEDTVHTQQTAEENPHHWMRRGSWARFLERGRHRNEIPPEVPWEDLSQLGMPWVSRWAEATEKGTNWNPAEDWSGPALFVNRGRVFLRMLRGGLWKRVPLPAWPELWALLLSWQLSPPGHPSHRRLRTLQWIWDDADGELVPAPQDCRAVSLLHSVCDANDRCEYQEEGAQGITVEGTSGLFYHVRGGHGAHGARFRVSGCTSAEQAQQGGGTPICIHEQPGVHRLPAGDVLASVVLSLMDDLRSQQNLQPLAEFIRANKNQVYHDEGVVHRGQGREVHIVNRINQMRYLGGGRRWTRVFPRLYEVLIRMPIDSVMLMPPAPRGALTFPENQFTMVIRDEEEWELIEGLARTTGWRRNGEQDGQNRWLRVDVPHERVRHCLVELLGPFQRRHGHQGDPPWWTLYREPFPLGNLPDGIPDALNQPFGDGPEDLFDAV